MKKKWTTSPSGVGGVLLAWLSLIQGPGGSWRGVMRPLSPPTSRPSSPWGCLGVPTGQGVVARPQRAWEAAVIFETRSQKLRRPALLLGGKDHHPGGRRRAGEHGRSRVTFRVGQQGD